MSSGDEAGPSGPAQQESELPPLVQAELAALRAKNAALEAAALRAAGAHAEPAPPVLAAPTQPAPPPVVVESAEVRELKEQLQLLQRQVQTMTT